MGEGEGEGGSGDWREGALGERVRKRKMEGESYREREEESHYGCKEDMETDTNHPTRRTNGQSRVVFLLHWCGLQSP